MLGNEWFHLGHFSFLNLTQHGSHNELLEAIYANGIAGAAAFRDWRKEVVQL